jgi:hypothetical protein
MGMAHISSGRVGFALMNWWDPRNSVQNMTFGPDGLITMKIDDPNVEEEEKLRLFLLFEAAKERRKKHEELFTIYQQKWVEKVGTNPMPEDIFKEYVNELNLDVNVSDYITVTYNDVPSVLFYIFITIKLDMKYSDISQGIRHDENTKDYTPPARDSSLGEN